MGLQVENTRQRPPEWGKLKNESNSPSHALGTLAEKHLSDLQSLQYSPYTILTRRAHLHVFAEWCAGNRIPNVEDLAPGHLLRYQKFLGQVSLERKRPLAAISLRTYMVSVGVFFGWLHKAGLLRKAVTKKEPMPSVGERLPRALGVGEIEAAIACAGEQPSYGVRDRAILEVLYSTGLRRMELANLRLQDLDFEQNRLFVSKGKGNKDRVVPIGGRAVVCLRRYLQEIRPDLLGDRTTDRVLLTRHGEPLSSERLTEIVRKHLMAAGIRLRGACHLFRHSCATLMLENGADIRFIQQLLGHAQLTTTQIYTQVSIAQLQRVHAATHPAERNVVSRKEDDSALENPS